METSKTQETINNILAGAFKLLLLQDLAHITVRDIEAATNYTRGSLFYHFHSKEDIFMAVVDKYYFETQYIKNKMSIDPSSSVLEFLYRYIDGVRRTMSHLKHITQLDKTSSYLGFIIQASRYYPNFRSKAALLIEDEIRVWKYIVKQGVINKELREDINIPLTIMKFRYAFTGMSFEMSYIDNGLDVNKLENIFFSIYRDIQYKPL